MQGEATIHVEASPEAVYDLVSDVRRMGDWSPECVRAEWVDGATGPAVGAKFKGHNQLGRFVRWSTTPEVTVAEPGREFAFRTKETVWRYRLTPGAGGTGTDVTESFETVSYGRAMQLIEPERKRRPQMVDGMQETLRRLKAAAESARSGEH
ncbi:MAG TPA: SRPBCC family protein [Acidimicrobiales bacterium]|nr:SRPBCC family protein [Acidimicrobiales bacterium]